MFAHACKLGLEALSELALELFFPADAETAEIVHRLAGKTADPRRRTIAAAE